MKMNAKTSLAVILLVAIVAIMGSISHSQDRTESSGQALRGQIPWRTDFDSARQEASDANKPVLLEFVATWCPDCHEMAKECWSKPPIITAMKAYVPVLIDVDAQPNVAKQYDIVAIPSLVVVDPKTGSMVRDVRDRVLSPQQLLTWLKLPN